MSAKKGRRVGPDKFERDVEKMIADYVAETGDQQWTRQKVAEWAIANDRYEQRRANAVKELSRTIGRVARRATFVDPETGREVRKYHAWQVGPDQPTLWTAMDAISRENMDRSVQARRDKLVDGAVKLITDADYYNTHHNPGDPIEVRTDLTKDVQEKRQPTLYDDVPPDDEPQTGEQDGD